MQLLQRTNYLQKGTGSAQHNVGCRLDTHGNEHGFTKGRLNLLENPLWVTLIYNIIQQEFQFQLIFLHFKTVSHINLCIVRIIVLRIAMEWNIIYTNFRLL